MGQREGRIQSAERAVPTFSFQARLRTFFQPDSGGLQAHLRKEGRIWMPSRSRLARASSSTGNKRKSWSKSFDPHHPANPLIPKWLIPKSFSESRSIILVLETYR